MPSDELRPYQQQLKSNIYASLKQYPRVLAQLPTGGGKSVIINTIATDAVRNRRAVLIAAHRIELVEQLAERLAHLNPNVITAGATPAPDAPLYIGMVQTLAKRTLPILDAIIFDEAHHAVANQYQRITEQQPNAKVIGFTATPERLDGKGLANVFDDLVCGPTVSELIELGYLSPFAAYSTPLRDPLDGIRTTAGDYNRKQLSAHMERSQLHGDLVHTWRTLANGQQTILFATSVELSKRYADEYNRAGIPAAHIDGNTDKRERARIIEAFRNGSFTVLTNCELITEGFDVPACGCVQIARPTKSLALYLQMVGRALRPAHNKTAVILDHAENILRHGLPTTERNWLLEETRHRKRTTVEIRHIDIGLDEANTRNELDHIKTTQLVEMTPQEIEQRERQKALDKLPKDLARYVDTVERNGYTNRDGKPDYHWAYKKWRESLTRKPKREELRTFAKHAGYHHGWVNHQLKYPSSVRPGGAS